LTIRQLNHTSINNHAKSPPLFQSGLFVNVFYLEFTAHGERLGVKTGRQPGV
jgi:hypothetical protein